MTKAAEEMGVRPNYHPKTHPGKVRRVPPHRSELGGKHPVKPRPRLRVGESVTKEPLSLIKQAPTPEIG